MNGIERRQYEMLVRVRNFGEVNRALFDASPVAQQTFAAVATAVNELGATDMKKMAASAATRAGRKAEARKVLVELLRNVGQLARNLRDEGRTLPPFILPASKSTPALLTAGRQFAVDVAPFDADFSGHGLGAAHIAEVTGAFERAVNDQGMSRSDHVAARTRLHDLIAAALRGVRRLDLIVANDLGQNNVVQAQWKQLRRLEEQRGPRGGGEPQAALGPAAVDTPEPVVGANAPAAGDAVTTPGSPQVPGTSTPQAA